MDTKDVKQKSEEIINSLKELEPTAENIQALEPLKNACDNALSLIEAALKEQYPDAEEFVGHNTTEAGLDVGTATELVQEYVDEETALRLEFEQAAKAAEERASTPFQVAAMTHARMCGPALEEIDRVSGGAAKRILKYLIAHPFYVKELNAQDRQVEGLAKVCDRLVHTKFTMAMCVAIEKEARVSAAIAEQEALIQDVPEDIPEAGTIKKEDE